MSETIKTERDIFIRFSDKGDLEEWDWVDYPGATRYVHHTDYIELQKQIAKLELKNKKLEILFANTQTELANAVTKSMNTGKVI